MSEENASTSPPEGSIPPVEPIVADDTEATPAAAMPEPAPVATATTPPAHPPSHVLMPKWVVFGVVGIALACLGFGIGWVAKPDSDSSSQPAASSRPFANGNPFGNNGGNNNRDNGNNNGNGNNGGTRISGAFLGVSATAATGSDGGAEVAQVVNGGPADDAGLAAGDVITKVDGTSITSPQQLVQQISAHDSGDKVTITYTRGGDTKTADVTLGDRADAPSQTPSSPSGSED